MTMVGFAMAVADFVMMIAGEDELNVKGSEMGNAVPFGGFVSLSKMLVNSVPDT